MISAISHRSYLFAPGSNERLLGKLLDAGADAVIVDLEDAVAASEKSRARAAVVAWLEGPAAASDTPAFVRINQRAGVFDVEDVQAVCRPGLTGLMLPKVESAAAVAALEPTLAAAEASHGLDVGSIRLLPLIESAVGLTEAVAIGRASTRIDTFTFGAIDLMADLGASGPVDGEALAFARGHLVVAARVAGLAAPIDTVYPVLDDPDGFERAARAGARLGFFGKLLIHPSQIEITHRVLTPTPEAIAQAQGVIAAFESSLAQGAAALTVDGGFVDLPVVLAARRTLDIAARLGA